MNINECLDCPKCPIDKDCFILDDTRIVWTCIFLNIVTGLCEYNDYH